MIRVQPKLDTLRRGALALVRRLQPGSESDLAERTGLALSGGASLALACTCSTP